MAKQNSKFRSYLEAAVFARETAKACRASVKVERYEEHQDHPLKEGPIVDVWYVCHDDVEGDALTALGLRWIMNSVR